MTPRRILAAVPVVVALSLAACGGNGTGAPVSSPLAPSTPSSPTSVAGATITGVLNGVATGAATGTVSARDTGSVTVTVSGTDLKATVDGQGKFLIKGVPAGTVTLTFSGTTATLTIANVGQTETITIVVVLAGNTASLETEQRVGADGKAQVEGRISTLGTTANTFYVGTTLITVPGTATIRHGDSPVLFSALEVGNRVHVSGTQTATGVTADTVTVQNTNPKVPVNLKGTISLRAGACPAASFTVDGWKVETNGSTDFQKGACADAIDGASVHVKGDVQASGAVLAAWVQFGK